MFWFDTRSTTIFLNVFYIFCAIVYSVGIKFNSVGVSVETIVLGLFLTIVLKSDLISIAGVEISLNSLLSSRA